MPLLFDFITLMLRSYGKQPGFAVISTNDHYFLLLEPVQLWLTCNPAEVPSLLHEVESIVTAAPRREDAAIPDAPVAAGFITYECQHAFERGLTAHLPSTRLPCAMFFRYRCVISINRFSGAVLVTDYSTIGEAEPLWEVSARDELPTRLNLKIPQQQTIPRLNESLIESAWEQFSSLPRSKFENAVKLTQEAIRRGDVYQLNLCQLLTRPLPCDPLTFALLLMKYQIAQRGAFVALGDMLRPDGGYNTQGFLISDSPELFFEVRKNPASGLREIHCQPIKGTRPRHSDAVADRKMSQELLQSVKDGAELAMIVDLLRNDLNRIAIPGSVVVNGHRILESHPTVHHLVAHISANLGEDVTLDRIFAALFPCGSITGAPKIAAMNLIASFEPLPRGVFTGTIGAISPGGLSHWNVAIRTATILDDQVTIGVGSGITIDSSPAAEYDETLVKLRAFDLVWREVAGTA